MKGLPDSAIVGTIGHARRRAAKSRAKSRKSRKGSQGFTAGELIGGISLMLGFMLIVSLFV